jgi:type IV secretory pathway VirB10-like protein
MLFSKPYRVLALVLAFALCGVPELIAQTQQHEPQPQPTQPDINTAPPDQTQPPAPQPDQAQPELPNAPVAQTPNQTQQGRQQNPQANQQPTQQNTQEPAGTAAAGQATTVGGAASKPAGSAIAPAKQRQVRSLLIKIGAIAAAGAALGIVYGLSKSTSSKPPGAAATTPAPAP